MSPPAEEPLDDLDRAILDQLRDPPPADLDNRARFAIALDGVDFEVARISREELAGSGARSTERSRTITFDSPSRTIMVTILDSGQGRVRVDGWLAPAARLRIELRLAGSDPIGVVSDDTGRFVFPDVGHGLAQLLVHPGEGDDAQVVTPSLSL